MILIKKEGDLPMAYTNYADPSETLSTWLDAISPAYFDFDTEKLHRTGVFGYMNEVMSTVNMDTYHGVAVARQEFYPNTANYTKSLFKMAALQEVPYPLANAGTATCVLLLKEKELLDYASAINNSGGTQYQIILDDDMVIKAGDIPFALDYPIKILISKVPKGAPSTNPDGDILNVEGAVRVIEDQLYYTVSYVDTIDPEAVVSDSSATGNRYTNSLNTNHRKYLRHRRVQYAGEKLLLIQVGVHQCIRSTLDQVMTESPVVNTATMEFPYTGDLCNFEVFYTSSDTDTRYQLKKIPLNGNPINDRFCMYSLTSDHTIRIHFPENNYFVPKFNSTITLHIYTTLGEKGNFRLYNGSLMFEMKSERYSYNKQLTIQGQMQGSCEGGANMPTFDIFRQQVIYAYATNHVIGTEQDLQMYFDSRMLSMYNKILFFKRRDDVFERLYGAFMLLKDVGGRIIPSNSLVAHLRLSTDFDSSERTGYLYGDRNLPTNLIIKPGRIWQYIPKNHSVFGGDGYAIEPAYQYTVITPFNYLDLAPEVDSEGEGTHWHFEDGTVKILSRNPESEMYAGKFIGERVYNIDNPVRLNLSYDITESTEEMYFTNPFLINISRIRNSVAFYINSFDTTTRMDAVTVNDSSYIQFISSSLSIQRNALLEENFYKLTIKLQPTISDPDLRKSLVMTRSELEEIESTAKAANGGQLIESRDNITVDGNYVITDFIDPRYPAEIRAKFDGVVVGYRYIKQEDYYCGGITPAGKTCNALTGIDNYGKVCPVCNHVVHAHIRTAIYQVIRYTPKTDKAITIADVPHDFFPDHPNLPKQDEYGNFLIYIRVSPELESTPLLADENSLIYRASVWYSTIYKAGERFTETSILGLRNCKDLLTLRVIGEINGIRDRYIPFLIEDYDESTDIYTLSGYISTNDKITDDGKLTINGGFYYDTTWDPTIPYPDDITIDPTKLKLTISTYVKYDDTADNNQYAYLKRHVLTNIYETDENGIDLLTKYEFVRASLVNIDNDDVNNVDVLGIDETSNAGTYAVTIKEIPVIRANWIKDPTNLSQLLILLKSNHDFLYETYDLLENNYSMDMKFYNTYGKSRFYRIGIGDPEIAEDLQLDTLDRVNIKLKFGVKISSISDSTMFRDRFVEFVKGYVEDLNNVTRDGDSINLMDMVTAINNNFTEIERLEYYGVDDMDSSRAQIINSWSRAEIQQLGYKEYIPEFINIYNIYDADTDSYEPDIELTILE